MKNMMVAIFALAGCATDGEPWTGGTIGDAPLALYSPDVGVFPDRSILDDPANPFADGALADDTIWQIQASGGSVAAFYAWGTALARGPYGERQYYAALDLKTVFAQNRAVESDLPQVRVLAIRGFQAVLDHFPDAVTYDVTGTIAYELATPSLIAILDLGGTPTGGWILVTNADGTQVAVRQPDRQPD
jgi:hypothetical protein